MRIVCPSCGAIASLEAWEADAHVRQTAATVARIPAPVTGRAFGYIALFRPRGGTRGLSWARAKKLAGELLNMVSAGFIEWDGRPARPCPPRIWAEAVDTMLGRGNLRLPMENHNYLRSIAYDLADQEDRRGEAARNAAERGGAVRSVGSNGSGGSDGSERVDPDRISRDVAALRSKVGKTL